MEAPEQSEIFTDLIIKISEWSHWLRLNKFHILFWCFHCWLWTVKYRLGNNPSRQCNQLKAQICIPNAFKLQDKKRYLTTISANAILTVSLSMFKKFTNMCSILVFLTTFTQYNIVHRQGVFYFERILRGYKHPHVLRYMEKSIVNISSKLEQNCLHQVPCVFVVTNWCIEFFWFFAWSFSIIKAENLVKYILTKLLF